MIMYRSEKWECGSVDSCSLLKTCRDKLRRNDKIEEMPNLMRLPRLLSAGSQ